MRVYNSYAEREKTRQFELNCPIIIELWDKYEERDDVAELEDEMIDWIMFNTKDQVYCGGDMLFGFKLESDAELFKLTWG